MCFPANFSPTSLRDELTQRELALRREDTPDCGFQQLVKKSTLWSARCSTLTHWDTAENLSFDAVVAIFRFNCCSLSKVTASKAVFQWREALAVVTPWSTVASSFLICWTLYTRQSSLLVVSQTDRERACEPASQPASHRSSSLSACLLQHDNREESRTASCFCSWSECESP